MDKQKSLDIINKVKLKLAGLVGMDRWCHIAIVKEANKIYLYKNVHFFDGAKRFIYDSKDWELGDCDFTLSLWYRRVFCVKDWSYAARWNLARHMIYGRFRDKQIGGGIQ